MKKTLKQILTEVSVILTHSPQKAIEYLEETDISGMDAAALAKVNHITKAVEKIVSAEKSHIFFQSREVASIAENYRREAVTARQEAADLIDYMLLD